MKTIESNFKNLNKASKLGTKFLIKGSDVVYVYDTCQLPRGGQFTSLNTKLNSTSKIGIGASILEIID